MSNKSKIREYFDAIAPERDKWKNKNSYYYAYIEKLARFLIPEGKKVLEIGCGTGDLLASVEPSHGYGLDFSEKMVEFAKRKHGQNKNLEFRVADAEEDSWGIEDKFDYVILSDTLGYINDVEELLKKLGVFIHPGSRILITQHNQLWEPILALGAKLKLKMPSINQNWLAGYDIENFLYLARLELVKKGSKLLLPRYLPILSGFCNKYLVNLFPFNRFGLVNYFVARPIVNDLQIGKSNKSSSHSVSIVVPARNEAGMIKNIVEELPDLGNKTELIFIEGHSTDNTQEKIREIMQTYQGSKILKFAVQDGEGKGDAVRKGFDMASGDILMIYDADMTVPPWELPKFYEAIVGGRGEFINGSRLVYPMEKESMHFLNYLGNKFFSFMFSWLLGQKIKDTLCGTKVLWRKDYEEIARGRRFFGNFDPFGDFDLLFGAAKLNLKIVDLPVHYRERTYGTTNISRWKHGWLLLKMVVFAMRKIKFI